MDELEMIWGALLSGNSEQIKTTWETLSEDEAQSIKLHLQKMMKEEGYSEVQKDAARQALAIIEAKG